jgi:hypothetical protein
MYDIRPVEWAAEVRLQQARREAEQWRLICLARPPKQASRMVWMALAPVLSLVLALFGNK